MEEKSPFLKALGLKRLSLKMRSQYLGSKMTLNSLVFIKVHDLRQWEEHQILKYIGGEDNPTTLSQILYNRRVHERNSQKEEFWPMSYILEELVSLLRHNIVRVTSFRTDIMAMELRWKIWKEVRGYDTGLRPRVKKTMGRMKG